MMEILQLLCVAASDDALASTQWRPSAEWMQNPEKRLPRGDMHYGLARAMQVLRHRCIRQRTFDCAERDIFEFGVYTGRYMRAIALALGGSNVSYRRFWGFDSFEGLPEEHPATEQSELARREWRPGSFSVAEALGDHSFASVQRRLKSYIGEPRVRFVKGFFNASLTPQLARRARPALFVDVDCDLYVSAAQALTWLLDNGLVTRGTLIRYDDLAAGGRGGEQRAHDEAVRKYGLVMQDHGGGTGLFTVLHVPPRRNVRRRE
jgi:hypothetical protein